MTEGPHLTPEQRKDLDRAQRFIASKKKTPRAPFFNGWMIFTCTILALISCTTGVAAVMDRDAVTLATLGGVILLAFGARSYQYFIQRK